MHLTYRPSIDGLRAIAILGVMIYHFDETLLPGGFVGVDVFFVISGYLISKIIFRELDSQSFSFRMFYARRIRRIFPALIFVISAVLVFGWFALRADEYQLLGKHTFSAATFLANFRLMKESGYFDVASHLKPLLHLWSLAIEEQFYIVWPLMLFLIARIRGNRLLLITGFMLASALASMWFLHQSTITHFFHPLSRIWELLAGALIANLSTRRLSEKHWLGKLQNNIIGLLGLILIILSYFYIDGNDNYPSLQACLPVIGSAMVIFSEGTLSERLLSIRPLIALGLISYPLYLWHWPVYSFIRISDSGMTSLGIMCLGSAFSICAAWLTYALVEKQIRYSRQNWTVPVLTTSMIIIAGCGKLVSYNQGFPNRATLAYLDMAARQTIRDIAQDNQCMEYINQDIIPYYCRLSKERGPVLAIIGDSHAHVLFSGIAERRKEAGASTILLANSGCPPLLGATFGLTNDQRAQCSRSIEQILNVLEKHTEIDRVLIATRGPIYITGKGFGPAEEKYNHPPLTSQFEDNHQKSPADLFEYGLKATVKRLHAAGKQVAYLLQVPELGISPLDCLGRPLALDPYSANNPSTKCLQPQAAYQQRMLVYRTLVEKAGRETSFPVYDPSDIFCRNGLCSAIVEGNLLYADDNHLSFLGSQEVAKRLDGFIRPTF